jgi:hypothetical protein
MNYRSLVPDGTFLAEYMDYMDALETPRSYDFFTGLWLLSLAAGRRVYVDRPRAPVYLNFYAILVAEAGITRKSTAVRAATEIARKLLEDDTIGLIEAKTTPEALEFMLSQRTEAHGCGQVAISVSELATFLGSEKYNMNMPALLTDLYDAPRQRIGGGTLSRGSYTTRDVFVSFLSASTPSWLRRAVNPDVIEGGFTSRCLFIHSEEPKRRIAWPDSQDDTTTQTMINRLVTLLGSLRTTATSTSTIAISSGGLDRFSKWYKKRSVLLDPFTSSFQSREDHHILRLAALLSINDGTWQIQANHVTVAIKIITDVRDQAAKLFAGTGATSGVVIAIERMREQLIAAGDEGVPRSRIYLAVRSRIDSATFDAILDIMQELHMIQRFSLLTQQRGRPAEIIRGTAGLVDKRAISNVLSKIS